jgi:hypothetical protein
VKTSRLSDVGVPLPDRPAAERASVAEEDDAAELSARNHAGAGGDACPGAMDRRKRRGLPSADRSRCKSDGGGARACRVPEGAPPVESTNRPSYAPLQESGRRFLGSVDPQKAQSPRTGEFGLVNAGQDHQTQTGVTAGETAPAGAHRPGRTEPLKSGASLVRATSPGARCDSTPPTKRVTGEREPHFDEDGPWVW